MEGRRIGGWGIPSFKTQRKGESQRCEIIRAKFNSCVSGFRLKVDKISARSIFLPQSRVELLVRALSAQGVPHTDANLSSRLLNPRINYSAFRVPECL